MTPRYNNILRLKYLGNGRYSTSWIGWPSEGSKRVSKRLSANDVHDAATVAAGLFVDWLSVTPDGWVNPNTIESVTLGQDSPDLHIVGVVTKRGN